METVGYRTEGAIKDHHKMFALFMEHNTRYPSPLISYRLLFFPVLDQNFSKTKTNKQKINLQIKTDSGQNRISLRLSYLFLGENKTNLLGTGVCHYFLKMNEPRTQ